MLEQSILGLIISMGVNLINHVQFVDDTIILGSAYVQLERCFKYPWISSSLLQEENINLKKVPYMGGTVTPKP